MIVRLGVMLCGFVSVAAAQERDEAFKTTAFHIVTAHECKKVTGDGARLDRAFAIGRERLAANGYDEKSIDRALAEIAAVLTDKPTKITAQMCDALLKPLET